MPVKDRLSPRKKRKVHPVQDVANSLSRIADSINNTSTHTTPSSTSSSRIVPSSEGSPSIICRKSISDKAVDRIYEWYGGELSALCLVNAVSLLESEAKSGTFLRFREGNGWVVVSDATRV